MSWSVDAKRDIDGYIVYRAEEEGVLQILSRTSERTYMDKDIFLGNKYSYAVKIVYADGTVSGVYK